MKKLLLLICFFSNISFGLYALQNDLTISDVSNVSIENNVSNELEKQVSKPFITKNRCLKALVVIGGGFGIYKLSKKATPYITRFLFPTLTNFRI